MYAKRKIKRYNKIKLTLFYYRPMNKEVYLVKSLNTINVNLDE